MLIIRTGIFAYLSFRLGYQSLDDIFNFCRHWVAASEEKEEIKVEDVRKELDELVTKDVLNISNGNFYIIK
jgi:hypothetical protein